MAALIVALFLVAIATFLIFSVLYPLFVSLVDRWHQKRMAKLAPQLDRMWLEVPANRLVVINIFMPLILGIAGIVATNGVWGGVIGLFFGLAIPFLVVKFLETRRKNKFAAQLVDGIMSLSSSLRAGLSLIQAFEVLVEELPVPISQEFGLVLRENKMGVPLETSLAALNKRMEIEELELLIDAMLIARESGGDLTKVFSRLATTIRDRNKVKEHIKTLTLQGRFQGILMSALPIMFVMWVMTFNKHHFDIMLTSEIGRFLLILAAFLQVAGMYLIFIFSKIRF